MSLAKTLKALETTRHYHNLTVSRGKSQPEGWLGVTSRGLRIQVDEWENHASAEVVGAVGIV